MKQWGFPQFSLFSGLPGSNLLTLPNLSLIIGEIYQG